MSHGDWKDMFKAVQENDIELVKFYIQQGVDINYQHPEFMTTALIESVRLNHLNLIKLLLENGAKPEIKEVCTNKNAVQISIELGDPEMISVITKRLKN